MPNISDLPLPLAILVAAFWVIQQIIAGNSKQIVALIDAFDKQYAVLIKDYQELVQVVMEDRQEARARWLERDRQLVIIATEAREAQMNNANEMHKTRGTINQITTPFQQMYRFIEAIYDAVVPNKRSSTRRSGPLQGSGSESGPGGLAND